MGKITSLSVWSEKDLPIGERMTEEEAAIQRGIADWKRSNHAAMKVRDEKNRAARRAKKP